MFVLRPAAMGDLPQVERIAEASLVGITSLPTDRETLRRRIRASVDSLAADVSFHGEESYFFVLEDTARGEIAGVSGIVASAGFNEPFFSYRNETIVHAAPELGIVNRVHALSLCHDLTGQTLLISYYVKPELEFTAWSDLLSRGRFLFMASHRHRFADQVVSEIVGVTGEDGDSPFWDSVGRRFLGIDYQTAERHCGILGRSFIAELIPQHPIYVPLLSETAQASIGQVNPAHEVAFEILTREGFEPDNYIDVFDGGPTVLAATGQIRTVAGSRALRARAGTQRKGGQHLVANTATSGFRATVTPLAVPQGDAVTLDPALMERLQVETGETVRVAPL